MKTILAHLKKDIVSFGRLAWIWTILIGFDCLAFLDRIPVSHTWHGGMGLVFMIPAVILSILGASASLILQILFVPVLIVQVIHADALTESDAFWRTRPISRGALLAEKALFITLLLAGMALAAFAIRFHSGNASTVATVLQTAVFVSGLVAFAAVTSSFSRLILNFIGIVLGAGVLASMVLGFGRYMESIGANLGHFPMSAHSLSLSNSGQAGTAFLYLGGCLTVVIYQYLTLKTNISRVGLFATFFLAALLQGG